MPFIPQNPLEGIGVDLIEVERISSAMRDPGFVQHILHPTEIDRALDAEWLAVRWAAKEAVAKAVGTHLRWHDVRIAEEADGRLSVWVEPAACERPVRVRLTAAAGGGMAIAWAIAEASEKRSSLF